MILELSSSKIKGLIIVREANVKDVDVMKVTVMMNVTEITEGANVIEAADITERGVL